MNEEQRNQFAVWFMAEIARMVKHLSDASFGIVTGRCDLEIVIVVAEDDKALFAEEVLSQFKQKIAAMTGVLSPVIYLQGNEPAWLANGEYIT